MVDSGGVEQEDEEDSRFRSLTGIFFQIIIREEKLE